MKYKKPELKQDKSNIESSNLFNTPDSCPYDQLSIEVIYSDGDKQVLSEKDPNPNSYGTYEFESADQVREYFKDLQTTGS